MTFLDKSSAQTPGVEFGAAGMFGRELMDNQDDFHVFRFNLGSGILSRLSKFNKSTWYASDKSDQDLSSIGYGSC